MAEKKMTRKEALEMAIDLVKQTATEDDGAWTEVAEVLTKMHEQVSKSRKKPEGPSKARRENEVLAREAVKAIAEKGEPVTGKWIQEHIRFIASPQKVTAVMKVAAELGLAERVKEGKNVTYVAV